MRKRVRWILFPALVAVFFSIPSPALSLLTELRERGYSLIPAPQIVELGEQDIVVDSSWRLEARPGVDNFTAQWLIRWAGEFHGLGFRGTGSSKLVLQNVPGTVQGTNDPALNEQGYRIEITSGKIEITGNSETGLFYGVQSLIQLLRRNPNGALTLPEGTITDWPDLEMRFVHWDTKLHQSRPETLKREMDWLAFFKVNYIAFDLDDRYEYPSHPIVGIPGAYTKEEMQEFTAYARERHIEFVPDLQSPAHMAYALKHPEFAHLRADGNNYQACLCDKEAVQLIRDLFQDLIDATPGVKYFHASMDEVYYAGICEKCKRPYNDENRSLTWLEYVLGMHRWLSERGRRMLVWVEYPLLPKHILELPPDIIDGVMGSDPEFIRAEKGVGIRQLAYTSMQGVELLFPNYFPTTYNGEKTEGRLRDAERTVREGLEMGADPIGSFAAAWDASGLHEETFWLGWITVIQYAWTYQTPALEQSVADFMDFFYGHSSPEMVEIYKLLLEGARFFEDGWDRVTSKERGPAYGNSRGKGIGTRRIDLTLDTPPLPSADNLSLEPAFSRKYGKLLDEAARMKMENDRLIALLSRSITQVERNRYNLEVFLTIAYMERYFIKTMLELARAEESLLEAARADSGGDPAIAVAHLVEASARVKELLDWGDWMCKKFKDTWEKSRYPKGRSVGGKHFVHILNDTKDLLADRRPGLEYMIAPFERMELPGWRAGLVKTIKEYAARHNVPVQGLAGERLED
ncbi:MAG TPA: beta-N-acetylhexosaminidase [archaeon]|nr:beta-N-acetylhexosaminidase [archaeon]